MQEWQGGAAFSRESGRCARRLPSNRAQCQEDRDLGLGARIAACRLAGAPPFSRGSREVPEWSQQQMRELQQLLVRRGYSVGEIDGKMGAATRASIKAAQMKFGLPADSYPTAELVERLRGPR